MINRFREEKISLEQFYLLRQSTDALLEFMDGVVFMSPSPSTAHQRISGRLHAALFAFLKGKDCEVFAAPYDIELWRDDIEGTKIWIPDLSVICEKSGLRENRYVGVPTLIVEILSPSNQSHDLVTKMNVYMQYGVKEYWVVNPMLSAVQIYTLDSEGFYEQKDVFRIEGTIESSVLKGFTLSLRDIF